MPLPFVASLTAKAHTRILSQSHSRTIRPFSPLRTSLCLFFTLFCASYSSTMAAAAAPSLLNRSHVIAAKGEHKYTIIWMHGLGDSMNGGMKMQAWYDIVSMDRRDGGLSRQEDDSGIDASDASVKALIDDEAKAVGAGSILVGGFSQGAAMSLRSGLSYKDKLAGIIAASGYLLQASKYPGLLSAHAPSVPILAYHGRADPVVPVQFAEAGYDILKKNGIKDNLKYMVENGLAHSLSDEELKAIMKFIGTYLYKK